MVAEQAMLQYDCVFVDDGQPVDVEICGIPVVGGLADLPELRKEYGLLVVGIGNNQFRAQVYEKAKALGFVFPNIVAPGTYISSYAKLGCGCVVLQNINTGETVEFEVSGDKIEAVHKIPGWTHNIINLSETENLVTVMTCNETFNPNHPDTFFEPV